MRFIARCYQNLNRPAEARMWLEKAINEAPYLRDPYVEMALLEYKFENWNQVEYYCLKALEITEHQKTYINEVFSWDHTIYDLLSLCYFIKKDFEKALNYVNHALKLSPNNDRLINNKKIIKNFIKLSK